MYFPRVEIQPNDHTLRTPSFDRGPYTSAGIGVSFGHSWDEIGVRSPKKPVNSGVFRVVDQSPIPMGAIYSRRADTAATEIERKHCIFTDFLTIMRRP